VHSVGDNFKSTTLYVLAELPFSIILTHYCLIYFRIMMTFGMIFGLFEMVIRISIPSANANPKIRSLLIVYFATAEGGSLEFTCPLVAPAHT
jgi:hypothetical protein